MEKKKYPRTDTQITITYPKKDREEIRPIFEKIKTEFPVLMRSQIIMIALKFLLDNKTIEQIRQMLDERMRNKEN